MTKASIKVISVLLCAVLIVCGCIVFGGCSVSNALGQAQLLSKIQNDFPEAHIGDNRDEETAEEYSLVIYLYNDEEKEEYLLYLPQGTEDLTPRCIFINLLSEERTKNIVNVVMPCLIEEWTTEDTDTVIEAGNANDDFTEWTGVYSYLEYGWGFIMGCNNEVGMFLQAIVATK